MIKTVADFITLICMSIATYSAFARQDPLLAMEALTVAFWVEVLSGIVTARRRIRRRRQ